MKHLARREPVYESLHALNHDFEGVLAELARLQELGVFHREFGNIFRIVVQKTRAWANFELIQGLQIREQDDLDHFGRLHRRWEKKLEDPYDVIIEAKRLMEKGQRAGGKKGRRKQRAAESEEV